MTNFSFKTLRSIQYLLLEQTNLITYLSGPPVSIFLKEVRAEFGTLTVSY